MPLYFLFDIHTMDSLSTFSILYECPIKSNNLIIPDNFNLLNYPRQIRELTYLYFDEIKRNVNNKITFEDIARYISQDTDFEIIPNTINSEIYYNNQIVLDKRFKFDYDFENFMKNNLRIVEQINHQPIKVTDIIGYSEYLNMIPYKCVHYVDGWNINNYLKNHYITLFTASQFKHSSEIIDFEYLKEYPDYFNITTIYLRFKNNLKPSHFKTFDMKCKFINLYLDSYEKVNKLDDEYFVSNYNILMKIFKKKVKRLPPNFGEIVMNLDTNINNYEIYETSNLYVKRCKNDEIRELSDMYIKWLNNNYSPDYVFPDLLMNASSLNSLFERNLFVPILARNSFNFDRKYLTLYDLICNDISFGYDIWKRFSDKFDIIYPFYKSEFRNMNKYECIAFYNIFYHRDVEFIKTVFEGKLLKYGDINKLEKATVDQLIYLKSKYPKRFNEVERAYDSLIKRISKFDYYEAMNKGLIPVKNIDFDEYYDLINYSNHDEYVRYVLNNHIIITISDEKLLLDERLKNNISWYSLINYDEKMYKYLEYFIDNIPITENWNRINKSFKDFIKLIENICTKFYNLMSDDIFDKLMNCAVIINNKKEFLENFKLNKDFNDVWMDRLIKIGYEYFFSNETNGTRYFNILFKECCYIDNVYNYILCWIKSGSKLEYEDVVNYFNEGRDEGDKINPHDYDDLACDWCKYRKCDPPYDMWPQTPNRDLQRAYRNYVSEELPKEYTDKRFYDYMMKNKTKRPEHCTSVYTLFSNNIENKIIFVDDTYTLDDKYAQLRFTVEVDYFKVRKFIGEELNINNMTTRSCLSDYDFAKVCGGNTLIDCFVFSDYKNIYKEITPLAELLEFFKTSLEMKFNVEVKSFD